MGQRGGGNLPLLNGHTRGFYGKKIDVQGEWLLGESEILSLCCHRSAVLPVCAEGS
jgi:hypothetical protein